MGIKLSKKHGVNPSIVVCPVCKKEMALALLGRLKGDVEAPKTIDGNLCDECKDKYVTIFEVSDEVTKKLSGRRTFIPKEAINIECKDNTALMIAEEFTKLFG